MLSVDAAITLLVKVLVAVPATLYARTQTWPPKRQVDVSVLSISPIFDMSVANKNLKVEYDGKRATEPHVCSIRIEGTGRYDVSSEQFSGENPITLDLGAPVLGDLQIESVPEGYKPALRS